MKQRLQSQAPKYLDFERLTRLGEVLTFPVFILGKRTFRLKVQRAQARKTDDLIVQHESSVRTLLKEANIKMAHAKRVVFLPRPRPNR